MQAAKNIMFDTVLDRAKDIVEEGLENTAETKIPYLDQQRGEQAVLECIQLGNLNLLNELLRSRAEIKENMRIGTLSQDHIKQLQYLGIVAVTLASRSAISGGVPENIALALSDSYIQQIEHIFRKDQLEQFYKEVFRSFCQMVHDHDTESLSLPVRQCCEYMLQHLYAKVTLEELSQVCHLSPNYVSDLFRKELKMGAIQYFHMQKLKLVVYFLLNTNLKVAEISAHLNYCSQSKLTQQFKKIYGVTPAQYRAAHKEKWIA